MDSDSHLISFHQRTAQLFEYLLLKALWHFFNNFVELH